MFLGPFLTLASFLAGNSHTYLAGDATRSPSSSSSLLKNAKTYEICISPGCVADGADQLLSKMQALAPSHVSVKPGDCCSLCGNGPIVLDGNNKKHRKVNDVKLIELLFGEEGMNSQQQAILDAFNLVVEAEGFLEKKNYEKAVELYGKGIELGNEPATATAIYPPNDGDDDKEPIPAALQWLVNARQQEAVAKLSMKDLDGAVLSAQSACELSGNSSLEALEVLQEAQAALGDPQGELETLQIYFALPEPIKMTTMQSNKRRNLGFRLQKLEREQQGK
ncbi:unnamed protein product [Cylindrotheca closterium]|uniref:Uncharacterized protein n=1 Tax=Cylindrotheca closterium TaxID=2856 RepID=A0AAD2FPT3_9STRA|nr:unnamed protein product [Cylindrotheca closterium]